MQLIQKGRSLERIHSRLFQIVDGKEQVILIMLALELCEFELQKAHQGQFSSLGGAITTAPSSFVEPRGGFTPSDEARV